MINHLIFVFFLLLFIPTLPSCTIFSGDAPEEAVGNVEEDYYPEEEGMEEPAEEPAEEPVEEPVEDPSQEEIGEIPADSGDDIEYIDEEDEDLLAEGTEVMDETTGSIEDSAEIEDGASLSDGDSSVDGSSSDFFDPSASAGAVVQPPSAKKWVSYKKIKNKPYNSAGFLINAVYIARDGDSMQSLSQKIFGSDQTQSLYAINPHLKARAVKTGDKIYYPSPHRPQDSDQLLFYFEDKGIPPNYHQVSAGENIRAVATSLLGHKDSWKEVWATNLELDSKGQLNQAITIKYWSIGADSKPEEPAEESVAEEESTKDPSAIDEEQPEIDPSLEPAEPVDGALPEGNPTPQPPLEEEGMEDPGLGSDVGTEDDRAPSVDQFSQMEMAIAGFLALGALILSGIIIKRKWKKKADFDYTAVNYEINE